MKAKSSSTIYWTRLDWNNQHLFLAASDRGLCYVGSPNSPFSELTKWVERQFPEHTLIEDEIAIQEAEHAILQYLDGDIKTFDMPLHTVGTSFQRTVWDKMCDIPYGETATYSDIAESIGNPKAVRAVASAIGANPLLIVLPCHRIIAKNGKLSGYRGGLDMKRALLRLEQHRSSF